MESVVIFIKRR